MSNNLDLTAVLENQANKENTINTNTGYLDAALTEKTAVNVSASNVTLTGSVYRRATLFNITGAATAGRTVTLPAIKKMSVFSADAGNTDNVTVVKGSTTVVLVPGSNAMLYTDGSANGLEIVAQSSAGIVRPYDIGTWCAGLPGSSEKLLRYNYVRNVTLPANLVGSRVTAAVAATAQTDFDVKVNNVSIGTIRFAIAGTTASFVAFAGSSIVINDTLEIIAPFTQDATLADISFTIAGVQV